MTSLSERQQLITLIDQATNAGARLHIACSEVNISKRTYRRWKADKDNTGDKRPIAVRAAPSNKLSDIERQAILNACNEPRFASLPPSQIVPTLLDEGIYHASESSFYRVLKGHNQLKPRGRAKAPNPHKPPETFIATKPCQVFCWDITYLPSTVRGQFYYLYMIEDVYSRKIVGFEVYDREAGDLAAKLLERTLLNE
ncbi:DDE-type integrase/transposase/recombinase, partial [Moraxella osloensis]|uniref:DDE-type integrase/transposase/recombinase n=1 Tax=Faucicola osloensis TaxID=34062 RepID=UPI0031F3DBAE|nr:IS3 family transposase [Moraxella osloensis]